MPPSPASAVCVFRPPPQVAHGVSFCPSFRFGISAGPPCSLHVPPFVDEPTPADLTDRDFPWCLVRSRLPVNANDSGVRSRRHTGSEPLPTAAAVLISLARIGRIHCQQQRVCCPILLYKKVLPAKSTLKVEKMEKSVLILPSDTGRPVSLSDVPDPRRGLSLTLKTRTSGEPWAHTKESKRKKRALLIFFPCSAKVFSRPRDGAQEVGFALKGTTRMEFSVPNH